MAEEGGASPSPSRARLNLVGDVGQYWLGLDNRYIMTAPAYRAFRVGLVVFAAGSILFGVAAGRDRTLPFAIGALCGLISFSGELGRLGAALWILFGLAWAWLGLACFVEGVSRLWRRKRTASYQ